MNVAVCVLWDDPDDPWRQRAWAYARARWRDHGHEPVTGRSAVGLVGARNAAARNAEPWDVAVFADADIVLGRAEQVDGAVKLAADTGSYVCCYSRMNYLDQAATAMLLNGLDPLGCAAGVDTFTGIWEGAFALSRTSWDMLGGMDERFGAAVGQSAAFIHAAATLVGLERVDGDAFHLWHPDAGRRRHHARLWRRYLGASGDQDAMRTLLRRRLRYLVTDERGDA